MNGVVLGLWDGHDAGAAVVVNGDVVSAVSEERLTRVKKQGGFPAASLETVLRLSGVSPSQVTKIAIAGTTGRLPARLLAQRYTARPPQQEDPLAAAAQTYARYQNTIATWPVVRGIERTGSRWLLSRRLATMGFSAPIALVDHHTSHAISAVANLNPDNSADALVLTMDGYGDGVSSAVWRWSPVTRSLELLFKQGREASLALLYGGLNAALGFAPGEEGKVTGLATVARSNHVAARGLVGFQACASVVDGRLQLDRRAALATLRSALAEGVSREAAAAALQTVVERSVTDVATFWLAKTGLSRLAVAGGLFANVSLNGQLARLEIDEFVVFGAMGDAGLCVGAALFACLPMTPQCKSLRLGPPPVLIPRAGAPSAPEVAQRLADGEVVAVCRGAMEFGPRALGGRSLLFDARATRLASRVGAALQRPSFMPFAPLLDVDTWPQLFDTPLERVRRCAAEMTIAVPLSKTFALPAATAGDGTARPQALDDKSDPWLRDVLHRFTALTGCPALVNTSLNSHREPISMTANDACAAAIAAGADALVVGDKVAQLTPSRASRRA